jgi:protein-disulfide isomerase
MKTTRSLKMVVLGLVVTLLISVLFASGCASKGEIIIEKVTVPDTDPTEPDQEFPFTLTGGPSALNQSFNLTNGQMHPSGAVLPGDGYNAAETVPAGWDLTSATCDDGSPVDNINVSSGETVTCTFENTKKVEIVLYTDFQCSHCWRLHSEVEAELLRLYVDTGKVDLDVRLLPAFGTDSQLAAEAALCAANQGQFREYRDAIFTAWSQAGPAAYSDEELKKAANQLGLNEEAFTACLDSGAKRAEVEDNMRLAEAAGINEVPTVFINGVKVEKDALFSLESYIEIIEELLAR